MDNIKNILSQIYESSGGTPEQRIVPSVRVLFGIICTQLAMSMFLECVRMTQIAAVLLVVSIGVFILFCIGKTHFAIYSLFVIEILFCSCALMFFGWNFGYSLFLFTLIPVSLYLLFVLDGLDFAVKVSGISSAIVLILFALLRFYVYRFGALYPYDINTAYLYSMLNWLISGFLLLHFCIKFVYYVRFLQRNLENKNQTLKQMALYDSLTGVRNRQGVKTDIDNLITSARFGDRHFTLIIGELDNFGEINNKYGHIQGDRVLMRLAAILTEEFKDDSVICRWGSSEFLIALPNDLEAAKKYCTSTRHVLEKTEFRYCHEKYHITVTFGIQDYCDEYKEFDTIFNSSDMALMIGKQRGGDCIAYLNSIWRY